MKFLKFFKMLLTNTFFSAILRVHWEKNTKKRRIREMFIYEDLKKFENEENNELAVSPIEYVVLNCGR